MKIANVMSENISSIIIYHASCVVCHVTRVVYHVTCMVCYVTRNKHLQVKTNN